MNFNELVVVLAGLGFGYLVVSAMMGGKASAARREADVQPEARSGAQEPQPPDDLPAQAAAWHEALGVPEDAPREAIQDAYRTLMSQYHPDKVATMGNELQALAVRKTQQVNAAYDEAMRIRGHAP